MRLIIAFYFGTQSQFQSTHPLRGATSWRFQFLSRSADFNPRTPCGVRPGLESISLPQSTFQSTHPLRGATAIFNRVEFDTFTFQSTHPLRGATKTRRRLGRSSIFQSTHPLRGATYVGDRLWTPSRFQSTHPLRGATIRDNAEFGVYCISIHAPLAGCDIALAQRKQAEAISIHAPLAGCDSKIAEIFPAILRKSYKISAKPNKERRCRVLGKGKAAAISGLARCEPPGENRNASGSHQTISAPSGS